MFLLPDCVRFPQPTSKLTIDFVHAREAKTMDVIAR